MGGIYMKKLLALTLCSAMALSVFSTGFKLNDTGEKAPVGDHAVIITDNTKTVDYSKDILASKGLELIAKMDKLAESTAYIESVSAQEDFKALLSCLLYTSIPGASPPLVSIPILSCPFSIKLPPYLYLTTTFSSPRHFLSSVSISSVILSQ